MEILKSPLFLYVLGLKLIAAYLFASHYLYGYFVPFVKQFVFSGLANPYAYFFHLGALDFFPYPKVMLWVLSVPIFLSKALINSHYDVVANIDIFIIRLPIILVDIVIFIILARWLKSRQKSVLSYYWCSPILFYINYIHGQLDVLPIMFLFVSLYFLFKEKFLVSLLMLGLAISAKTGMALVLPFVFVYFLSKRIGFFKSFLLATLPVLIFFLLNLDYLLRPGFFDLVLKTREEFKVFDFQIRFNDNFVIYIVPLAYLILLARSLAYRAFNRDLFLMFLGFSFGILTIFIPPMQGWYYWVIPFLVYFYIKNEKAPKYFYVLLNIAYFAYFLVIRQSDLFEVFHVSLPWIASLPNFYDWLHGKGIDPDLLVNIVFTGLQGVLAINVLWVYRKGVESYVQNKIYYQPYLIGVAGDSGSGKTTFAALVENIFSKKEVVVIAGDDMHKWERGDEMWTKYTHLDPRANKLHAEMQYVYDLKSGLGINRSHYDHDTGKFTLPIRFESKKVVVLEGLHSLFLDKMRRAFDLKVFIQPEEELRLHWKIRRDSEKRGYTKEKVLEQILKRRDDSEKYISVQSKYSDIIISLKNEYKLGEMIGEVDAPVDVYLEITCSNNIDLGKLLDEISKSVEIDFIVRDEKQIIKFKGGIDKETIEDMSYVVAPEIDELGIGEQEWQAGYNGLIQLFLIYYIFESMKMEKYGR